MKKIRSSTVVKWILYFVQGMLVGVGAILPGVSGGVLCVAFGIYEPMMELFTHPIRALKKHFKMFVPIGIGAMVGFVLLAGVVDFLLSRYESITVMLFLGLISGTLPALFKTSEQSDPKKSWTPFVLALVLLFCFFRVLESSGGAQITPSVWSNLFSGVVWGLSLIVPGLSSSSVLMYLGLYEPMVSGIKSLDLSVLVPLFIGIAASALLLARLANLLFQRHYAVTSRVVLGFVIASSLTIVPTDLEFSVTLVIALLCFAVGFAVARGMDLVRERQI